jgi:hypothetical protein
LDRVAIRNRMATGFLSRINFAASIGNQIEQMLALENESTQGVGIGSALRTPSGLNGMDCAPSDAIALSL